MDLYSFVEWVRPFISKPRESDPAGEQIVSPLHDCIDVIDVNIVRRKNRVDV